MAKTKKMPAGFAAMMAAKKNKMAKMGKKMPKEEEKGKNETEEKEEKKGLMASLGRKVKKAQK